MPHPQVVVPIDDEAHQPLGPEPAKATTDEDVRSARVDPSAAAPSAPALDMPMTSA